MWSDIPTQLASLALTLPRRLARPLLCATSPTSLCLGCALASDGFANRQEPAVPRSPHAFGMTDAVPSPYRSYMLTGLISFRDPREPRGRGDPQLAWRLRHTLRRPVRAEPASMNVVVTQHATVTHQITRPCSTPSAEPQIPRYATSGARRGFGHASCAIETRHVTLHPILRSSHWPLVQGMGRWRAGGGSGCGGLCVRFVT